MQRKVSKLWRRNSLMYILQYREGDYIDGMLIISCILGLVNDCTFRAKPAPHIHFGLKQGPKEFTPTVEGTFPSYYNILLLLSWSSSIDKCSNFSKSKGKTQILSRRLHIYFYRILPASH